jgi:hypothetical protein
MHSDLFDCLGDFVQTVDNPDEIKTLALHTKGSIQYKLTWALLTENQRNISQKISLQSLNFLPRKVWLVGQRSLSDAKNQNV